MSAASPMPPAPDEPVNPFRKMRADAGFPTIKGYAEHLGLRTFLMESLEAGRFNQPHEKLRPIFERLGHDFDQLRRDYVRWRDHHHGVTFADLPAPENDREAAIQAAIKDGHRGTWCIARAADVPVAMVNTYLREGKLSLEGQA